MADAYGYDLLFSSFNARNMTHREIATSFVPPEQFDALAQPTHAVLIGPRGSGKTTLLKMLEVPALRLWKSDVADKYRDNLKYIGVFIPADILWGKILAAIETVEVQTLTSKNLSRIAFRNHCILSLLNAIEDAMQLDSEDGPIMEAVRIKLPPDKEQAFAKQVGALLRLGDFAPSVHGLQTAIRHQLLLIEDLCIKILEKENIGDTIRAFTDSAGPVAPLQIISAILDELQPFYSKETRWALLFDELEIAPLHIRKLLIESMRSIDQRLLLKLAFSPADETLFALKDQRGPEADQDYTEIILWYESKEKARNFCKELSREVLRSVQRARGRIQRGNDEVVMPIDLAEIFGQSAFDSEVPPRSRSYSRGTQANREFLELSQKDRSFRDYLSARGISPNNFDALKGAQRASQLRKIKPIVVVRNYFLGGYDNNEVRAEPRSRKTLQLYTGLNSLWAISEGNPRWLIGLLRPLLFRLAIYGQTPSKKTQADKIGSMAARFRASLRTVPVATDGDRFRNLGDLVDEIGSFFHDALVGGPFRPEPPGSFIVDDGVPPHIVDAISRAQEIGAVIWLKAEGDRATSFEARPIGRRYRLCHLVGSINGLTLTTLGPINLSIVLSRRRPAAAQLSIFDYLADEA